MNDRLHRLHRWTGHSRSHPHQRVSQPIGLHRMDDRALRHAIQLVHQSGNGPHLAKVVRIAQTTTCVAVTVAIETAGTIPIVRGSRPIKRYGSMFGRSLDSRLSQSYSRLWRCSLPDAPVLVMGLPITTVLALVPGLLGLPIATAVVLGLIAERFLGVMPGAVTDCPSCPASSTRSHLSPRTVPRRLHLAPRTTDLADGHVRLDMLLRRGRIHISESRTGRAIRARSRTVTVR